MENKLMNESDWVGKWKDLYVIPSHHFVENY